MVPVALTGGFVAFNTGGDSDDTLYSQTEIDDGFWHHVVVTRNQSTGDKQIYIDDVLDSFDNGSTVLLNDPQLLVLGCLADSSDSQPDSPGFSGYNGYDGELDDLQIYNRVLSADDVDYLYNNPGNAITNNVAQTFPAGIGGKSRLICNAKRTRSMVNTFCCFPASVRSARAQSRRIIFNLPPGNFIRTALSSTSYDIGSLGQVLSECTNGLWQLYINKGDPVGAIFHVWQPHQSRRGGRFASACHHHFTGQRRDECSGDADFHLEWPGQL